MEMIALADRLPNPDEHSRVIIYTEGYDFDGQQFFDVKADLLNVASFEDAVDQPEECKLASHWMPLPYPIRGFADNGMGGGDNNNLSAAPDLFEACKRASEGYGIMMHLLDKLMPGWRRSYNFHHGKAQIDEAIAKAKGEEA